MDVKAKWYRLDDQKPLVQLVITFFIVLILGTILFYLLAIPGSLLFGSSISEMTDFRNTTIDESHKGLLKFMQVSQEITLFIIPGLILAAMFRKENESFLRINRTPEINTLLLVILLALALIPVTMYTGILNSKLSLPEQLSGIEKWIKSKEEFASDLTDLFIRSSGAGELVINIFILALLPSIAEEIIFRGILQNLLSRIFRSANTGIWVTAIIFSAIHLQFYGFLPRLILGLSFGYLFYWSGNLWLPVMAHFVNNLVPVIMAYALGWEDLNEKTGEFAAGNLAVLFASVFICALILYHFRSVFVKK
jgi:uncharacterized protein